MSLKINTPTAMNIPPPALSSGGNDVQSPPPAGKSKCSFITPKAFNMNNPVQAAGAARGRRISHILSELRRSSTDNLLRLSQQVKIFYHKGHKSFSQRSQKFYFQYFAFVYFVYSLCALWLKNTFKTTSLKRCNYSIFP